MFDLVWDANYNLVSGEIESSERFKTLTDFSSIYGIGPHTARRLFDLNLRTFQDLEVYYAVDPSNIEDGLTVLEKEDVPQTHGHHRSKGHSQVREQEDDDLGQGWVKVALGLREDLAKK